MDSTQHIIILKLLVDYFELMIPRDLGIRYSNIQGSSKGIPYRGNIYILWMPMDLYGSASLWTTAIRTDYNCRCTLHEPEQSYIIILVRPPAEICTKSVASQSEISIKRKGNFGDIKEV